LAYAHEVFIRPNNITGFSGINQAIWTNQPREWTLATSFKF
jgi:hypothetical protein